MPRIVKFSLGLITLLLAFMLPPLVVSCDNAVSHRTAVYKDDDAYYVKEVIQTYLCPTFDNVQSVLDFRSKMQKEMHYDSVFLAMPEQVLQDVANVLIARQNNVCMETIVNEYLTYRSIYDNLQPPDTSITLDSNISTKDDNITDAEDNSIPDTEDRRITKVISTSYQYRTDTINGKPVKIRIKTEEAYD